MNRYLKISNYKCFGSDPQGFEHLKQVNILVGRNHSGKSVLLEVVQLSAQLGEPHIQTALRGFAFDIHYNGTLDEKLLREVFPENTRDGPIPGNHWTFGRNWTDAPIKVSVKLSQKTQVVEFEPKTKLSLPVMQAAYAHQVSEKIPRPFVEHMFVRLRADRDIVPEPATDALTINENGSGVTNVFRKHLTIRGQNRDAITRVILLELNRIFEPDGSFEEIYVLQLGETQNWEIYLREKGGNSLPVSQCGSGLKTLLLVLAVLHLGPVADTTNAARVIHAFEELENNLHPAAHRRLLTYLYEFVRKKQFPLFLTTHSGATIDFFSRNEDAQIIHVQKIEGITKARTVTTYIDRAGILDDLDIRASDLLQANGVIWVEGPSDRTYINKWIFLRTNDELKEGIHYQVVFYGGRLLSHLCADPDDQLSINLLSVNRNLAVVIDSDHKKDADESINATKLRIKDEVEKVKGFAWVSGGREIENYVPMQILCNAFKFSGTPPVLKKNQSFFDATDVVDTKKEGYWKNHKILLAERLTEQMTNENAFTEHDLASKIDQVVVLIKKWNSMGSA
jgi:putative ATP-dependent endonuclease of the OLD family